MDAGDFILISAVYHVIEPPVFGSA